ncbi:MAG: hypothetical protein ACRDBG_00900 [Waterburya sp.]
MHTFLLVFLAIVSGETILLLFLHLMPRLGGFGEDMTAILTQAPGLDVIVSLFLWVPWVIGGIVDGWLGLIAAIAAQFLVMQSWIFVHELSHRKTASGSRIHGFLNQKFGWWRNNVALWATALAVPVFFVIRFAEVFVYPILVWVLDFPNYKHHEWVNVSRQKFQGLIGKDLIWCLYCDWMTGVYSLGAEMLRNVESFWCPIRFYDGKKCDNCKLDFPDIENGWIAADGTMDDVEELLKEKYGEEQRSWFNHPDRQS